MGSNFRPGTGPVPRRGGVGVNTPLFSLGRGPLHRRQRFWAAPLCGVLCVWVVCAAASAVQPPAGPGQGNLAVERAQARFPRPRSDRQEAFKSLVGQVVNKEGQGLAQAVVHLKNKKTLEVRTHICDEKGAYRFNGLDRDTDYAVHAEYRGASSAAKTVSSFDDRSEVYLVLEIDTTKQ